MPGNVTLVVHSDSQQRFELLQTALAKAPPSSLKFIITLSTLDGPGEISRIISQYFVDQNPAVQRAAHMPALQALWVEFESGTDGNTLAEANWQEPFRFRQAQYASFVVVDCAFFVADSICKNPLSGPEISISIDKGQFIDALSAVFLFTLVRLNICQAAIGFSGIQEATNFQKWVDGLHAIKCNIDTPEGSHTDTSGNLSYIDLEPYRRISRSTQLPIMIADARLTASPSQLLMLLLEAACSYNAAGFYDFSIRYIDEALDLLHRITDDGSSFYHRCLQAKFIAVCCKRDVHESHSIAQLMLGNAIDKNDGWAECQARYLLATTLLRLYYPARTAEALTHLDEIESKLPAYATRNDHVVFSAFLHNTRAFAFFHLRDFNRAYQACEKALECLHSAPATLRASLEEGTFLYNLSQLAAAESKYDDAVVWIRRAIDKEPFNSDYYAAYGNYLSSLTRYTEALDQYKKAQLFGVPTPELLVSIASSQLSCDRRSDTLATLQELRMRFPSSIEGFLDAAAILIEENAYSVADEILNSSLIWHYGDSRIWCNLGRVAHDSGRLQDAVIRYSKALELNPQLKDAWINLGVLRFEFGDLEAAHHCLQCALAIAPSDPMILENLAVLEAATKKVVL
jgi:tetratricopeptide (TPR) repeat protein